MRRPYTPTLPEILAFRAAAESGSVTRAAENLGVTQSAVSRALGSLEGRLGVLLFMRVKQRLVITDAGKVLLREAGSVLDALNEAALRVMAFGGHRQILRVATFPNFGTDWLVPRLTSFQRRAPDVIVDVSTSLKRIDFDNDPIDVAVQRTALAGPNSRVTELFAENFIAVEAPGMSPGESLPLELRDCSQLVLLQQSTRPELWLHWFRDVGLNPVSILRGPRFELFGMMISAAKAGLGIALVPDILVADDLQTGALVKASDRALTSPTPYALIQPDREETEAARLFRLWLTDEADIEKRKTTPQHAADETIGK